jgi:hypothetical protein
VQDTKLIRLLSSLTLKELADFSDFVASPYFNKSPQLCLLADYYIGVDWSATAEPNGYAFAEEDAFAVACPDKSYDRSALQRLNSRLTKLLEEFVIVQQRTSDDWHQSFALLQFYNQRNLNTLFENHLKTVQKEQAAHAYRDSRFFFKQYILEVEISNFESYKNEDGTGDVNFQTSNNALDTFYICSKIEQLCLMLNRARATRFSYDYTMLKRFLTDLEGSEYAKNDSISLWYSGLKLLNEPNATHHKALKTQLKKHPDLLPKQETRHLYTYLENAAREVYGTDRILYLQTLFELYESQLTFEIIYTKEGFLPPQTFYNIFVVAMALKKEDWANDFLTQNRYKIIQEYENHDTVYDLCQAILLFEQQQYDAAIDTLNETHFESIYFKMNERRLRLKLYFETQEWSLFESLINSFRKFLTDSKNKLPETQLQPQRDFVTAIVTLYKMQDRLQNAQSYALSLKTMDEILTQQPLLPEKKWVETTLNALKR